MPHFNQFCHLFVTNLTQWENLSWDLVCTVFLLILEPLGSFHLQKPLLMQCSGKITLIGIKWEISLQLLSCYFCSAIPTMAFFTDRIRLVQAILCIYANWRQSQLIQMSHKHGHLFFSAMWQNYCGNFHTSQTTNKKGGCHVSRNMFLIMSIKETWKKTSLWQKANSNFGF